MIWDLLATLAIAASTVDLVIKGHLSPRVAFFMLLFFVIFRAFARARGGVSKFRYYLFQFTFLLILTVFVGLKRGWANILSALVGTFYGGLEVITVQLIKLVAEGYIGIPLALLAVFLLVFLRWLGSASLLIYHTIFSILASLFIILIFLTTASHGNWKEAVIIGASFMALVIMLEGVYLMFYETFRRQ